jgi:two-component system response regulator NreC
MVIRVVVIESHHLMLRAIVDELQKEGQIDVVATANHGSALLELARQYSPDLAVLDLSLAGGFDPVAAVKTLRWHFPDVRVLILTAESNPYYVHALVEAGATGYIMKSDNLSLTQAVRQVYAGKCFYSPEASHILLTQREPPLALTRREIEVLSLAARGYQNNRIAEILGISCHRVRHALSSAYEKLDIQERDPDVNPRVAAINKARQMGLLSTGSLRRPT